MYKHTAKIYMYIQQKSVYIKNIIYLKGRKSMGAFDRFWKRDELIRKTIPIDNDLYEKLGKISKEKYHTSKNQLINACIENLIQTENIKIYKIAKGEVPPAHSLLIRKSLFEGLEDLRDKYNLSISKLLNIAINNAIEDFEKEYNETL